MYFYKVYIWLRVLCSKAACHRNMKHTQTLINQYTLTNRMHSCSWAFCFRMCVRLCVLMIRFNSGWRGLCLCPFMSWFYRLKHLTIYHSHRERAAKDAPRMWLNITVWNLYLTANITTNWAVTELIRLVSMAAGYQREGTGFLLWEAWFIWGSFQICLHQHKKSCDQCEKISLRWETDNPCVGLRFHAGFPSVTETQ